MLRSHLIEVVLPLKAYLSRVMLIVRGPAVVGRIAVRGPT
jgi:hypothetical protein